MVRANKFIVFEGIDGSGKTTQCNLLHKALSEKKIEHVMTQEPHYQSPITGPAIKKMFELTDAIDDNMSEFIAMLMASNRYEHLFLKRNELNTAPLLICDRYVYSSIAYQGTTERLLDWVRRLNSKFLRPDIVFYLNIPPEKAVERIAGRKRDVMEQVEFLRSVNENYYFAFKHDEKYSDICVNYIDATESQDVIAEKILDIVLRAINKRKLFAKIVDKHP